MHDNHCRKDKSMDYHLVLGNACRIYLMRSLLLLGIRFQRIRLMVLVTLLLSPRFLLDFLKIGSCTLLKAQSN